MAGKNDNLIPFTEMSKEKHRELSKKGGINSGIARQERRQLKEELSALLSSGDTQERVCLALIDKVLSGDANAFRILRDSLGETESMSLELVNGASLEKFRESHKQEILQLCIDETKRVFNREPKRYGQLAHCLASKQIKDIAFHQLTTEMGIAPDPNASTEEIP